MSPASNGVRVAIVDYSLGNLFSVQRACEVVGLEPFISSDRREITSADAIIVPGVGAFGDAMATLNKLDLVGPLRDWAAADRPLVGICLGLQLVLSVSEEFGQYQGLNLVAGSVVRFDQPIRDGRTLKVPQVGWNRLAKPEGVSWDESPLAGLDDGVYQYFVHSYHAQPRDPAVVLSTTTYGHISFCSSLRRGNLFACQFHPERSGHEGMRIYRNLAAAWQALKEERAS